MDTRVQSPITLNQAQQAVLEWIRSGCPDGVYDPKDSAHRGSARALHNRGLIQISGRGATWSATLTERGEKWPEAVAEDLEKLRAKKAATRVSSGQSQRTSTKKTSTTGGQKAASKKTTESSKNSRSSTRSGRRSGRSSEPEFEVVSPAEARRHGRTPKGDKLTGGAIDPWDEKIMITVKEAAWMLSLPETAIREAVANGDVLRVFIGSGKTNYRIVYGSLLAWVDSMPREPGISRRWWR